MGYFEYGNTFHDMQQCYDMHIQITIFDFHFSQNANNSVHTIELTKIIEIFF